MGLVEIGLRTDLKKLARALVESGIATQDGDTLTIHLPTAAENLRRQSEPYNSAKREYNNRIAQDRARNRAEVRKAEAKLAKEFPGGFRV